MKGENQHDNQRSHREFRKTILDSTDEEYWQTEVFAEAAGIAIEALEKQIPKKIHHEPWNGIDGVPYDLCPSCKTNLCTTGMFADRKKRYCGDCGQKLDWE